MRRTMCLFAMLVMLLFVVVPAMAQSGGGLQIVLSWSLGELMDPDSIDGVDDAGELDGFEGALVLPVPRDSEEEVLRSSFAGTSRDGRIKVLPSLAGGKAVWSAASLGPGRYSFYVSDPMCLEGMSAPKSFARAGLRVTVTTKAGSREFVPPDRPAAIWHVFDFLGEDGSIIPANTLLPFRTIVYGSVMDAVTGLPVEGASVSLYSKVGATTLRDKTDRVGRYAILADFGAWELTIQKDGYIGWKDRVAFIVAEYPARRDAHLSSVMLASKYRFVLSWGSRPYDLDAHALGPLPDGGAFHISYRVMRAWGGRHFLDRDDTESYGPETITLERLDRGMYVFAVHDYSNRDDPSSLALSYSGAVVRVYRESAMVAEARVPEGIAGTLWRVFGIDGSTGMITPINTIGAESDPGRVR